MSSVAAWVAAIRPCRPEAGTRLALASPLLLSL
jgi:hypothetical protein